MKFRNASKALFVGFNETGNIQFPGPPVRIKPGETGEFSHRSPGVDIAVKAGIIVPVDRETKKLFEEKQ